MHSFALASAKDHTGILRAQVFHGSRSACLHHSCQLLAAHRAQSTSRREPSLAAGARRAPLVNEFGDYWISFARMLGSDLNASAEALQALAMLRPNPAVARV